MKKKALQGLALGAAGAITASSVFSPVSVSVIAETNEDDVVEDTKKQSDNKEKDNNEENEEGKEPVVPTLKDINVLATVSINSVDIDGKLYVKDAPKLNLATACSLEGISLTKVALKGTSDEELYSYEGGNTNIDLPSFTEEQTDGKTVGDSLSLVFSLSDGTELSAPLSSYVSNLTMSSYTVDSDAPVVNTDVSFTGKSQSFGDKVFYTSDGEFTVQAVDSASGIATDKWEVKGVSNYTVSEDGNAITFSSSELKECSNPITIKVEDNVGNINEISLDLFMFREPISVQGISHSEMYSNGSINYVNSDGFSLYLEGTPDKVAKYELFADGTCIKESSDGNFDNVTVPAKKYYVIATDVKGDTYEYDLGSLFSDLSNTNIVIDTDQPTASFKSYDGDSVSMGDMLYLTEDGTISFSLSDATSGVKTATVSGMDQSNVKVEDGVLSFTTNSLAEGRHDITIHVEDNVGNTFDFPYSFNMYRETPAVKGVSHSDVYTSNGVSYSKNESISASINYDTSKVSKIELYRNNNLVGDIVDGNLNITEAGNYSLKVYGLIDDVYDYSLNDIFPDMGNSINFDTVSPALQKPVYNGNDVAVEGVVYYTEEGTISVSALEDGSGINRSNWTVEGVEGISSKYTVSDDGKSITIPTTALPEGESKLTIKVKDNVGNESSTSLTINMYRESSEIEGISHSSVYVSNNNTYTKDSIDVEFKLLDESKVRKVELVKNGSVVGNINNGKFSIDDTGKYTIRVTGLINEVNDYDLEDIFSDLTSSVYFDNEEPTLENITFTGDMKSVDGTVYYVSDGILNISVDDSLSGIDKSSWSVYNISGMDKVKISEDGKTLSIPTSILPEGRTNIEVHVKDNLGNEHEFSVTPYMHRTSPEITGVSHSGDATLINGVVYTTYSFNIKLDGVDSEKVKKIELLKDGNPIEENKDGVFSIPAESGEYTIKVTDIVNDTVVYSMDQLFDDFDSTVVVDNSSPEILEKNFSGNKVTVDDVEYYTTNGIVSIVLEDLGSGIDDSTISIKGIKEFDVSEDGSKVTFSTESLKDGNIDFTVIAKDKLGNLLSKDCSIFMHRTFPEISGQSHTKIVNQDGTTYANKSVEVTLKGYDSYKVKKIELVKGNQVVDTIEDGTFIISESGNYEVRVTDIVNNVQNYKLQDLFSDLNSDLIMDTVEPQASATVNNEEISSDKWIVNNGILNVSLSDEVGLRNAIVTVNGKEFTSTFNSTKKESITIDLKEDVPRSNNGVYKVSVEVTDISGNTSKALSKTIKADFDKPTFSNLTANGVFVEDGDNVYIRDTLRVTGSTTDVGSGVDKVELLNNGEVVATGFPFDITKSGSYILRVYDVSGLYTDVTLSSILETESNNIIADNTHPIVERVSGFDPNLVLGGTTSWYNSYPELVYNITDDNIKSVSIKVNGKEQVNSINEDGKYTISTNGIEGKVDVEVEAVDKIGFTTKDSFSFYVDTCAPENVVGVIDKDSVIKSGVAFFKETPSISIGANDKGVGLDKYVLSGNKDDENTSGHFTLGTGSYFIEVKDKLGNTTGKLSVGSLVGLDSNKFVVDGESPVIDASRPSGDINGWFAQDVNYNINLSDNIGIDNAVVYINGEIVDSFKTDELDKTSVSLNADTSKVLADSNGMYHIQVFVQDNAGNISSWEDAIYIDRTAPTVDKFVFTGNGYQEGVETNGSNRYGFFFDGSASCEIYVSDGQISSGMNKLYVTLEDTNGKVYNQVLDISSGVAKVEIPDNFKGFISAYATDLVNNIGTINSPDGVITEDSNCHINNITMNLDLPKTSYTDISGNPLYNEDVNIQALIGCDMSGLRSLSWGINDNTIGVINVDENGNISGDTGSIEKSDKNLVLSLSKVLNAQGNTNGMNVWVNAVDRTGHSSEVNRVISIDKDAPVINVSYDNTEADGYYNSTRTATIEVQERNFDASQFTISGDYGTLGTWHNEGDTWFNTITFSEDGDYQFSLGCTDRAGNVANGYSSEKFTIDKTAPIMTVSWNNDNPSNGNYYNTQRTATITVVEHNFDGSLINITGNGTINGWSSNGDTHTATVSFPEDGEYQFSLSGSDLAGNSCEGYDSGEFIIDTTAPTLTIDGVQASVSYKEDVGFTVDVQDKYIDVANTSVDLSGRKNGNLRVSGSSSGTSGHYSFASMPMEEMYDDVYTLNARVTDMAGNVTENTIVFSVNRFGSKYTFLDASMLNTYLNAPRDVVIEETNVDKLDTSKARVSVIRDGSEVDINPDLITISESGGESDKYNYTYTVSKEAFDTDGKYLIQVFSHAIEGTDYSSVSEEYAFVLDTHKPEIIISGVESNEKYRAYEKIVTLDVRDMTGVKSISAKLNGKKVNLNKKNDVYSFKVSESEDVQNLVVEVTDLAGNTSTSSVDNFLITSNAWLFIVNQTWFKLGIGAGAAFLAAIIALIIKNRRDSKKEEEASMKEHEELYKATGSSSTGVSSTSSTGKDMVEDLESSNESNSEDITEENSVSNQR